MLEHFCQWKHEQISWEIGKKYESRDENVLEAKNIKVGPKTKSFLISIRIHFRFLLLTVYDV